MAPAIPPTAAWPGSGGPIGGTGGAGGGGGSGLGPNISTVFQTGVRSGNGVVVVTY